MLIGQEIEDIGKMVGGWRKGLIVKTSAEAEEKKWVADEDLIASVPFVRIRNRISVDVPVAIVRVPVTVDRPIMYRLSPVFTALWLLLGLYFIWDLKVS